MSDPALALQKAIYEALRGETGAGYNVFDTVPSTNPFPRIVIGPAQTIGAFADCYDGSESFLQIDVYSIKVGSLPEVKAIASEVRDILHDAELTLEGHILELIAFESTVYSKEADNRTGRARMTIRAESHPDISP